ncbi:hypothetical protein [Roseovarius sp. MMSF_3350]|uniref:hypothetical protein n=1 Tax=Roseovarius sp. MMSF_3350 TaxID=3046706 RepID=UPI00273F9D7C|nr:hypothetical protein [Roseovarius sp. MMSF_3350]
MTPKHSIAAIAALLIASTAQASGDIQNHEVQRIYLEEPCSEVIRILDSQPDLSDGMDNMINELAIQGMTWGHLLGVETANPGIRGTHETILQRLRADCAADDNRTAMQFLMEYAAER